MSRGDDKGQRRFVLLDRDGTVIVDRDYLADPAGVELLPGAGDGLRRLQDLGLGLVIVSNQSGVGRGYFGTADVARVNRRLAELLAARGVRLDGVYYCPHAPAEGCRCRKPQPGMVEQAARDLGFEPKACFMIGDQPADMGLGRAVGAVSILISTEVGGAGNIAAATTADHVCATLVDAARIIEKAVHAAEPGRRR